MTEKLGQGYIAITTSLILSFLLLIITTSVGFSTWFSRFGSLNSVFKETSFYVAETCLEKARLRLAQNGSYAGNEDVSFSSYTCHIYPIEVPQSNERILKARAQVKGTTTNFKLTVNYPLLTVVSREEINKLP